VTLTLSSPVRYAALLALLAAVLIGGGTMVLGGSEGSEPSIESLESQRLLSVRPAATRKAPTPAPATKPTAAPVAPPVRRAPERPSAMVAALKAGLPLPLARALGQHRIVVISLFNPYSQVDGISFAEARAGAQLAGVGFVSLNVLSQAQVGKLTEQLGLLPNPGLLIYVAPSTLVARISGFADKETVAQAAQNAAAGGT
jgi:hypothetical protein